MPYEQALAHYEIGRRSSGSERQHHLHCAADMFAQVNATYDLERVQAAAMPNIATSLN
jgi:hypothetical protein